MANFCGGIKLNEDTLKVINGIICDAGATTVDKSKAVSTCGQLWDGALFTTDTIEGHKVVTLHNSEGEEVGTPVFTRGNCGVGLDARFFHVMNGEVVLQDGFLLTVVTDPADATVNVPLSVRLTFFLRARSRCMPRHYRPRRCRRGARSVPA